MNVAYLYLPNIKYLKQMKILNLNLLSILLSIVLNAQIAAQTVNENKPCETIPPPEVLMEEGLFGFNKHDYSNFKNVQLLVWVEYECDPEDINCPNGYWSEVHESDKIKKFIPYSFIPIFEISKDGDGGPWEVVPEATNTNPIIPICGHSDFLDMVYGCITLVYIYDGTSAFVPESSFPPKNMHLNKCLGYYFRVRSTCGMDTLYSNPIKSIPNDKSCIQVNKNIDENNIAIFPQPAQDQVRVKYLGDFTIESINICNSNGQKIMTIENTHMNPQILLDFSDLSSGIYFAQIQTQGGTYIRKITIISN